MNALKITSSVAMTMTSREIADLVESRHDKVKQSIERLAERGVIDLPLLVGYVISGSPIGGAVGKEYRIGKRDSYIIVAQLSPEFTARLVDRWQELESRSTVDPMQALSDPAMMRGLLLTYTEKVLSLEATVQAQAPKVAALDRIATASDGSFCIRDAAKNIQMPEKEFRQLLIRLKWVYVRPGGKTFLAYAPRLQQGAMEHKITSGEKDNGTEWINTQARITAKGMARLAEIVCNDLL